MYICVCFFCLFMLHFLVLAALLPLGALWCISRGDRPKPFYSGSYVNPYLEKYLATEEESTQQEKDKRLAQAAAYLQAQEQALEKEIRRISGLYFARMISNTLWADIKKAQEELQFESITLEGEIERISKDGHIIEVKKEPSQEEEPQDEIPTDCTAAHRELYQRILNKISITDNN